MGVRCLPIVYRLPQIAHSLAVIQHNQVVALLPAVGNAHNFQPQAVQSSHIVARLGGLVHLFQPLANGGAKIVYAGVQVGDDEDLLARGGVEPFIGQQEGFCNRSG